MAQPDDLEARVAALETEVHELSHEVHVTRQDAVAARVLAGGADRDVSEIRGEIRDFRQATTATLNALREDQLDIRRQMAAGFAKVDDNFAKVDDNFVEMRGKFEATAAGQQQIVELLNTVISRQDGE
ncbi:MAG TPA: permease [Pseudonocardiaceae bacterium]|nr:permease [Pseudonocardiaceae bacterium]